PVRRRRAPHGRIPLHHDQPGDHPTRSVNVTAPTHAWQNAFHRLARCYERRINVINAFFDLADAIITVRSLIRRAWTTHRWDARPHRRP
ncbi:IS5/IS1182 family transposase, partial [Streptomyces sp. NPDC059153]